MQYKTMILELLQQHPEIYNQLRCNRVLPATLNVLAYQLKMSHEHWKSQLSHQRPGSNQSQIASEALEFALKDLEDGLRSEFPSNDSEPLPDGAVMVFIRGRTPRA